MSLLVSFFLALLLFGVLSAAAAAFVCSLVLDTTIHQLHNNFIIIIQQFRNPTDQKVWNNTFASQGVRRWSPFLRCCLECFLLLLLLLCSLVVVVVERHNFSNSLYRRPSQITSHASARARVRGHGRKHPPTRGYRRAFRRG